MNCSIANASLANTYTPASSSARDVFEATTYTEMSGGGGGGGDTAV